MKIKKYSLFKNIKLNSYIVEIILMLLLACILFFDIKEEMTIHNATDEFGYWTAAANILGWDWSNCASLNTYFAFGYGVVLAVLLFFFTESVTAYKAALVLNIVFILVAYVLWNIIFTRLFPSQKRNIIVFITFCISCYSCNYVNTKHTLSECLLWFLFSFLVWALQQFILLKKVKWLILAYGISVYMFMVHMRTIGILCALTIFAFGFYYTNFGKRKMILCGAALICFVIVAIFIEELYKNQLIDAQYSASLTLSNNTVEGQISKIRNLFSAGGIIRFVLNVCGRFFYFGFSTVLFIYFGLLFYIKKLIALFKAKDNQNIWIYIFMGLSFAFAMAISALYTGVRQGGRADLLFYGRYSEYVIAPILFFGIIEFLESTHQIKLSFTFFILQIILTVLVVKTITVFEMKNMLDISIPGLYYLLKKNNYEIYAYWLSIIVISLIAFLICFIMKNKNTRNIKMAILVLCLFFIYSGYQTYQINFHKHDEGYVEAYEIVKSNSIDGNNVYYCYDSSAVGTYSNQFIDIIQFSMREKVIKFKMVEDYDDIPTESIIITRAASKCLDGVPYQPLEIFKNDEFIIYKK